MAAAKEIKSQEQDVLRKIFALSRTCSAKSLGQMCRRDDIRTTNIEGEQLVYGYWLSIILISAQPIKLAFKVHFFTDTAKRLLAQKMKFHEDKIPERMSLDFMREFCNLTAGNIKHTLAANKVISGLSLPLITQGFDEVVFAPLNKAHRQNDFWHLDIGDDRLTCSVHVHLQNCEAFKNWNLENVAERKKITFL